MQSMDSLLNLQSQMYQDLKEYNKSWWIQKGEMCAGLHVLTYTCTMTRYFLSPRVPTTYYFIAFMGRSFERELRTKTLYRQRNIPKLLFYDIM